MLNSAGDRLEGVEALAAVIRIKCGNFRLMERLFAQMKRIMALNRVERFPARLLMQRRTASSLGPETDNYLEEKAANYL
ncbi:hypothetical protein BLM14_19785 (plasmid) [Phyllobacterium zundukense]|nr:hypothetical protein BLM14_19785 [Phyllobacterium zundukense]